VSDVAREEKDEQRAVDGESRKRTLVKLGEALRQADERPKLVVAAKLARELLPGDKDYGDPLSTAGSQPSQQIGRRLSTLSAERPSLLGELGLSALQVWEVISDEGSAQGERELAIVFTDLVDFSSWSLKAGDTVAVELLRQVGQAIEPPVERHHGTVVKRLGDGLMAAFDDPRQAVEAAVEASRAIDKVEVNGYRPRMRAGVHMGKPRRIGGDYLGTDVNIAARVADAARAGEVLVSETVRERVGEGTLRLKRRRFFRAKGAPRDLAVYAVKF
jgi:adenylate cyclase